MTLFQLLESEIFADRICQLCQSDLTVFSHLRDDLISKQRSLYQLAGLDPNGTIEVNDEIEESSSCEEQYESTELEDTAMYVEEEIEEHQEPESYFLDTYEQGEISRPVLKIEKVEHKNVVEEQEALEDSSVPFDFFEEIVGTESNDQKDSDGDNSKEKYST